MPLSNRAAVTMRFNQAEQSDLRELCRFWNRSEKDMLKFAFQQLVLSTKQIAEKIAAGVPEAGQEDVSETPSTDSSESQSS